LNVYVKIYKESETYISSPLYMLKIPPFCPLKMIAI